MEIKKIKLLKENLKKPNKALIDKKIKNFSGIYFLFNDDLELLYIGQTDFLRKRLLNHISPRNKGRIRKDSLKKEFFTSLGYNSLIPIEEKVNYYSFLPMKSGKERKLHETLLIMLLNPKYNYKMGEKNDK